MKKIIAVVLGMALGIQAQALTSEQDPASLGQWLDSSLQTPAMQTESNPYLQQEMASSQTSAPAQQPSTPQPASTKYQVPGNLVQPSSNVGKFNVPTTPVAPQKLLLTPAVTSSNRTVQLNPNY